MGQQYGGGGGWQPPQQGGGYGGDPGQPQPGYPQQPGYPDPSAYPPADPGQTVAYQPQQQQPYAAPPAQDPYAQQQQYYGGGAGAGWQAQPRVRRQITFADIIGWTVLALAGLGLFLTVVMYIAGFAGPTGGEFGGPNHWEVFRVAMFTLDEHPLIAFIFLVPIAVVLQPQLFPGQVASKAGHFRIALWLNTATAVLLAVGAVLSFTLIFGGTDISGWEVLGITVWALGVSILGAGLSWYMTRLRPGGPTA